MLTPFLVALCVVLAVAAGVLYQRAASADRSGHATVEELQAAAVRLAAESALLRAEFDTLFENCGAATLLTDAGGIIRRANESASHLLSNGLPIIDKPLLQATMSAELQGVFRTVTETQEPCERDVRMPGPEGRVLRVAAASVNGEGDFTAVLIVAHDVTGLLKLNTMRRDFVANVSHELRTPLAAIRAMAETLQDGAVHDPQVCDRFLNTIIVETDRLTRIAADLLTLSDAESRAPDKAWFSLRQLMEAVSGQMQAQATQAGITLTCEIAAGDLDVCGSRDQIEQVLVNLIDNAIKYSPSGGAVSVHAAHLGTGVEIRVRDTGTGILSSDLPRIFERFYRADKARSRESGGTGLGLAIVKHIVEAHNGQVTVQSELNHGTEFCVTLP